MILILVLVSVSSMTHSTYSLQWLKEYQLPYEHTKFDRHTREWMPLNLTFQYQMAQSFRIQMSPSSAANILIFIAKLVYVRGAPFIYLLTWPILIYADSWIRIPNLIVIIITIHQLLNSKLLPHLDPISRTPKVGQYHHHACWCR